MTVTAPTLQRRPLPDYCATQLPDSFLPELPGVLRRVYAARGIRDENDLDLSLSALLPPAGLKGIASAVDLLACTLREDGRIVIVGDFDADGATSCALAVRALEAMGCSDVRFLVPNRFEFGYGLTPEIVEIAALQKPALIVTVDNGISSVEGVAAAKKCGIAVLVTDPHLPPEVLPAADAIVNPNQTGCTFQSKALAGVGVTFYLMTALRSHLRDKGWFRERGISEPNMADYLDLVALGTVADVVPLDHNNRILVEQGLRRIRVGKTRPGIRALVEVAGRNCASLVASDLGFSVAPRLNAAGRLDDIAIGISGLLTRDDDLALEIARELDGMNRDRRAIETGMREEAEKSLDALVFDDKRLPVGICLHESGWHQGVVGILASRVKERFHRPVICFAPEDDTCATLKGSARSIQGFHIRDALDAIATSHPGLIDKFGGHAMAAGLSLQAQAYPAFAAAFDALASQWLSSDDLHEVILTDGELLAAETSLAQASMLEAAMPWGQQFPEPLFDGRFELVQQKIVGGQHLKLVVRPLQSSELFDGIAFNVDTAIWPDTAVAVVRLAYKLSVNRYRGRESVQLMIQHMEKQ